jgi:hypothetical protein
MTIVEGVGFHKRILSEFDCCILYSWYNFTFVYASTVEDETYSHGS